MIKRSPILNDLLKNESSKEMLKAMIESTKSDPGINVIQFLTHPTHVTLKKLEGSQAEDEDALNTKFEIENSITDWGIRTNSKTADSGHLLLALSSIPCAAFEILKSWELSEGLLLEQLHAHWEHNPKEKIFSEESEESRINWKSFGRELTELEDLESRYLTGRSQEVKRVIQVLSLKETNNPILVGENGVGKTAIIEGIAQAIASSSPIIPESLKGAKIFELNSTALVSGTTLRGQLEERIQSVIDGVKNDGKTILLLDNIHNLTKTGGSNSNDAGTMIAPVIARGEIQAIGTTSPNEIIALENDAGIIRNFQKVTIDEAKEQETVEILKAQKPELESHHCVSIPEPILEEIVKTSKQEITNRAFPEKAISLLDQACAAAVEKKKDSVRIEEIHNALNKMTGIPDYRFSESPKQNIDRIEDILNQKIIGQDEPKMRILECLLRAQTGIKDPDRPIGNILLLGESGTGKTLTCKTLAKALFGSESSLIRFDMGEFQNSFDLPKIMGSTEKPGKLARAINQNPYQIVLFDEIEKAHPDIFDCLLQIMEDGTLTDGTGMKLDMRHCMIMMTSNIGADQYSKGASGFGDSTPLEDRIQTELEKVFRPEFLNRMDEITIFRKPLSEENLEICRIEIQKILDRAKKREIHISMEKGFLENIGKQTSSEELRGRELRRKIERTLGNFLSQKMIEEEIVPRKNYEISGDLENTVIRSA